MQHLDKGQALHEGRADFRKEGIMYMIHCDVMVCGCGSLVKMWRVIKGDRL